MSKLPLIKHIFLTLFIVRLLTFKKKNSPQLSKIFIRYLPEVTMEVFNLSKSITSLAYTKR